MIPYILIVGQLPPPVHGSNVMTGRFMQALTANGYDCGIVEKNFSRTMSEVGKASPGKLLRVPGLYWRVLSSVRLRKPDVCVYFITVGLSSLLVDCLILRLLQKEDIPYVLYFHGRGYRNYESPRFFPVRGLVHSVLRNALGGLVLGERLKEDINHCIPNDRLFLLPNGIPASRSVPDSVREEDDGMVRIVFLSNLIPSKGPMRFLKMAKLVRAREPRVRFIVAGSHASEKYLHKLKDYIAGEGLGECVALVGPVYGRDKNELLRRTDILVFPTEKETFGIVNIEAMQWGVPVVSSPVGAIPEIVRDGVNGYIVEPGNIEKLAGRVMRLVRDGELRLAMGRAGKELFECNYSLEAYTRNTRQAMEYFMRLVPGHIHHGKAGHA